MKGVNLNFNFTLLRGAGRVDILFYRPGCVPHIGRDGRLRCLQVSIISTIKIYSISYKFIEDSIKEIMGNDITIFAHSVMW